MTEQSNIQKIKQLLKSDDGNNSNVAIQLMKGQGIKVNDIVNSIDENDIIINSDNSKILLSQYLSSCWHNIDDNDELIRLAEFSVRYWLNKLYHE